MVIHILLFAQLRDAALRDEYTLDVEESATVGEVIRNLFKDERLRKFHALPMRFAVNENFADETTKLYSKDRLAIIPPVAGGS